MPKPPTGNSISQGRHGTYNAVDNHSWPDRTIYAPEDGRINNYVPNNGNMGNNLFLAGATGQWAFSHLEKPLVNKGDTVSKGQAIGIMGYTGYVIPAGEGGRHLHTVLYKNGQWVYPPDHYTEPFNTPQPSQPTQGAIEMINTADEAVKAYKLLRPNYHPNQDEINSTAGKRSWLQFVNDGQREREQRDAAIAQQAQAVTTAQQEAQNLRNTITQIQQVNEQNQHDKDAQLAALGGKLTDTTNDLQEALLEVERLNNVVCNVPTDTPKAPDAIGLLSKFLSLFVRKKSID